MSPSRAITFASLRPLAGLTAWRGHRRAADGHLRHDPGAATARGVVAQPDHCRTGKEGSRGIAKATRPTSPSASAG